jgi:hypothetical protein
MKSNILRLHYVMVLLSICRQNGFSEIIKVVVDNSFVDF